MFDITSSKLLILGAVALLVIGPKDLPALLRTLGRYMGIIKRQAAEFRAQFDEAMRETEVEALRKEVETLGSTAEAQMRAAGQSVESELSTASASVTSALSAETGTAADGNAERPPIEPTADQEGAPEDRSGATDPLGGAGPAPAAAGAPEDGVPAKSGA